VPRLRCHARMNVHMNGQFRSLPSVDRVVEDDRIHRLGTEYPHELIVEIVRQRIDRERASIGLGGQPGSLDDIVESVVSTLVRLVTSPLRPTVNATGVILHTNLGRAPLSRESMVAMERVSRGYANVELDLDGGGRGSRQSHIEPLLCQLTGAEAGFVVNNNAAAVLLGLAALAARREVIVSRGQAVEIGDSFRIPDVMRQSGAKLIEVGTTNCTYVSDYEGAITERTVALMRVHSSNFEVVGFTQSVGVQELGALGRKRELNVLDDLGSGCLLDTAAFGLRAEPTVQESVAAGASLAFFSGDKLLGGPQAGIIVGRRALVDKLRRHPLARAVRIDKVRLAGLHATLVHYAKDEALRRIPIWMMIAAPVDGLGRRAAAWAQAAGGLASVIDGESVVGGGSLPGRTLPTKLLAIPNSGKKGKGRSQTMARMLRANDTPVIARIADEALLLDPRSVFPDEDAVVIEALKRLRSVAGE
jgi:L-seryl-tRNA(Ser) seleniumtransferase